MKHSPPKIHNSKTTLFYSTTYFSVKLHHSTAPPTSQSISVPFWCYCHQSAFVQQDAIDINVCFCSRVPLASVCICNFLLQIEFHMHNKLCWLAADDILTKNGSLEVLGGLRNLVVTTVGDCVPFLGIRCVCGTRHHPKRLPLLPCHCYLGLANSVHTA